MPENDSGANSNLVTDDRFQENAPLTDSVIEEGSDEGLINLPLGEALTVEEAGFITISTKTKVVVLAGTVDCGKTTLIASLFHCFQQGPFAGFYFSGSNTLVGFDKRCHKARISSGRSSMKTDRTPLGEQRKLLHMKLRDDGNFNDVVDILFMDMSGEEYDDAKDSIDYCKKLNFINRSDAFSILVDSEKLGDKARRNIAKNDTVMLLRSCIESGQLGSSSAVDIIYTKWDLFPENDNSSNSFLNLFEEDISSRFQSSLNQLRFHRVAARPASVDKYTLGFGLDTTLKNWIATSGLTKNIEFNSFSNAILNTEFDKFLKKSKPHLFKKVDHVL